MIMMIIIYIDNDDGTNKDFASYLHPIMHHTYAEYTKSILTLWHN